MLAAAGPYARLDPVGGTDKVYSPGQKPRARVALLAGCAQRAVDRDINAGKRSGCLIVLVLKLSSKGAYCCARWPITAVSKTRRVMRWRPQSEPGRERRNTVTSMRSSSIPRDAGQRSRITVTGLPVIHLAEDAALISGMAMDITEFLGRIGLGEVDQDIGGLRVTYHSACSMQHGQQLRSQPQQLLRDAGFDVLTPHEAHICCGAAGTIISSTLRFQPN